MNVLKESQHMMMQKPVCIGGLWKNSNIESLTSSARSKSNWPEHKKPSSVVLNLTLGMAPTKKLRLDES